MVRKKRGVTESEANPAGRWVVVGVVVLGAVLAIVATVGHPRVRMRPREAVTPPRLAVLPFENQTGRAQLELLASDVTKAVTDVLEAVGKDRFEVVPREASLSYKDVARGIAEVAETLECDYVIAGRVDAPGDTIQIDLYLFKAGEDPKLWPDRLEWEKSQIGAIPQEIAERIRRTLMDGSRPDGLAP